MKLLPRISHNQLQVLWGWWIKSRRFMRLFPARSPRENYRLLRVGRMLANHRKFMLTSNPTYLSRAMDHYFFLRTQWLILGDSTDRSITITGWATRGASKKMKTNLPKNVMRTCFRPDVWFLQGSHLGFFSGFEVNVKASQFESVKGILESETFRAPLASGLGWKGNTGSTLRWGIDSVHNSSGGGSGQSCLLDILLVAPEEFAWLVEAGVDRAVANQALFQMETNESQLLGEELTRSLGVLALTAHECPGPSPIKNWGLVSIVNPIWRPSEQVSSCQNVNDSNFHLSRRYFESENVTVLNGGILFMEDNFVNWDTAQHPSLGNVAGNKKYVIGTSANLNHCLVFRPPGPDAHVEKAILLGSRADWNWFHFLIETLPRLLIVEGVVPKDVPVLVSNRVPPNGLEALRLLTNREIILSDPEKLTRVSRAYVPGPLIYHPDTQFTFGDSRGSLVNKEVLAEFRRLVLEKLEPAAGTSKTYFARSGKHRNLINKRRVNKVLTDVGYVKAFPERLSFREQVGIVFASEEIVLVGGASMANLIFAKTRTKLTVLTSDLGTRYLMPIKLAEVSGCKVIMVGGKNKVSLMLTDKMEQKFHTSFRARVRQLKVGLNS